MKRFLDKELGEKKIYKMISRWEMLEDCERTQGESTQAFVDRYVRAFEAAKSVFCVTIPPQMKAFMLLRRLRVKDEIRRALILSKLDHEREEEMYDQIETQILEVMGGGPGRRTTSRGLTRREVMSNATDESCHATEDSRREQGPPNRKRWEMERQSDGDGKLMNRAGPDGKPMTCHR